MIDSKPKIIGGLVILFLIFFLPSYFVPFRDFEDFFYRFLPIVLLASFFYVILYLNRNDEFVGEKIQNFFINHSLLTKMFFVLGCLFLASFVVYFLIDSHSNPNDWAIDEALIKP